MGARHFGIHPVAIAEHLRHVNHPFRTRKASRKGLVALWAVVAALIVAALILSNAPGELSDEARQYCQNVRQGVWPDYANRYAAECSRQTVARNNAKFTTKR
jgi:hypothetical protein